jgi:hypothetical protein
MIDSKVNKIKSIRLLKLELDQLVNAFLIPQIHIIIDPGKNMKVIARNRETLLSIFSFESNTKNRIKLRIARIDVNLVPISLTNSKFSVSKPSA